MELAIRRDGAAIRVGLHARRRHDVVDMHACPVMHPGLFALLHPLRTALRRLSALRREGSVLVTCSMLDPTYCCAPTAR